ncbi:MAG: hypothetical protein EPN97_14530 [Alphaproteobacteria bacterium]|nr:MAG: hypothetical protein EPN97_14530 [Alphaproteobacteria bacterium]
MKQLSELREIEMPVGKFIFVAIVAIMLAGSYFLAGQILVTNDAGNVQVKQAAATGTMSVRTQPGVYLRLFSDIHNYKISDTYDFNKEGTGINVRFNDSATANVYGSIKYRLPTSEDNILAIHTDFRSYEAVQDQLVRAVVEAVVIQTATMFSSEEIYSTRRSDFVDMINQQIKAGIFATKYSEVLRKDEDGNSFIQRAMDVRRNDQGQPYIAQESAFARYHVELIQLVLTDIDFDPKTDELIAKRKEAEQEKIVAKSKAERAKQDAVTAEAQGKANVALAEAEALVLKKTAVIAAEREKEVAIQEALKAEEVKKAIIARGQADAEAAKLKVAAGLTPLDKATIEKETKIEIAKALSAVKFPEHMIISGGGAGGGVNPFEAVGLKALYDLSNQMSGSADGAK